MKVWLNRCQLVEVVWSPEKVFVLPSSARTKRKVGVPLAALTQTERVYWVSLARVGVCVTRLVAVAPGGTAACGWRAR